MTGAPGPGDNIDQRVSLGNGISAVIDTHAVGNEGLTIFWRRAGIGYTNVPAHRSQGG